MSRKPYKTYSREFKIEAVRLAEQSDKPVTQIARELGVRQNQIYKWKKQLEAHC
jgi:transposase